LLAGSVLCEGAKWDAISFFNWPRHQVFNETNRRIETTEVHCPDKPFVVMSMGENRLSGGAVILNCLVEELKALNCLAYKSTDKSSKPSEKNLTTGKWPVILIAPEGIQGLDSTAVLLLVRWMLAPPFRIKILSKDEWAYYYVLMQTPDPGTNRFYSPIPDTSFLLTLSNPVDGDGLINEHRPRPHKYVYTIRKGNLFGNLEYMRDILDSAKATHLLAHNLQETIEIFQTHKYFVCYDPYSFLMQMAAMCGCIPIVVPINGTSKYEWNMRTWMGPYMRAFGLADVQGIAYGNDPKEIAYASATMQYMRAELFHYKKWARERTVKHFVNTVNSYLVTGKKPDYVKTIGEIYYPQN